MSKSIHLSLEDLVMQQSLTKCGPKVMRPSLDDLWHSGLQPNVAQEYAPHQRTLSRSGLQTNVAKNIPIVGGLYHPLDFDQMWPKNVPIIGGLWLAKCGPRICPSLEDFVTLRTLTKCTSKLLLLIGRLCPNADSGCKRQKWINSIIRIHSMWCCGWDISCCILCSLQQPMFNMFNIF